MSCSIRVRVLVLLALLAAAPSLPALAAPAAEPAPPVAASPRLVVVIVFDQMRADFLNRFASHLSPGGFRLFAQKGASFTNAYHGHAVTYTGPGHAVLLSGSYGCRNGIVANSLFNRERSRLESMVFDPNAQILGAPTPAGPLTELSPRNLIGDTIGDEMKLADAGRSKVIALSLKGRAAILPGGKTGTAYWFQDATGEMSTSTYYMKTLPAWVRAFNAQRIPASLNGSLWNLLLPPAAYASCTEDDAPGEIDFKGLGRTFPHALKSKGSAPDADYYTAFTATPWSVQYLFDFARAAVENEGLGNDSTPDLLAISVSTTDYAGHAYGPYSREIEDLYLRSDGMLASFLAYLQKRFRPGELVVALSSDHGAAPTPEYASRLGLDAGRIGRKELRDAIEAALDARYGDEQWVLAMDDPNVYLNRAAIQQKRLDPAEVERAAGEACLTVPGIDCYYTRSQLLQGAVPATRAALGVQRSFHAQRSGDVLVFAQPFHYWGEYGEKTAGTTHGTPYSYDTHVPMAFYGAGIRPGVYRAPVATADLAPTLCYLLRINPPAGCEGRALLEALR